jgi:hypothetical protein
MTEPTASASEVVPPARHSAVHRAPGNGSRVSIVGSGRQATLKQLQGGGGTEVVHESTTENGYAAPARNSPIESGRQKSCR